MRKLWIEKKKNEKVSQYLQDYLNLPAGLSTIISTRTNIFDASFFVNSDITNLRSPFDFYEMDKVVDLIKLTIKEGKNIFIYGDYDCDGITSTSILYKTLKDMGGNVKYHIPNRSRDGYGLNKAVIEKVITDTDLFITVDCGITNFDEINYIKSHKCKIIVTDHHENGEYLPNADFIINPKIYNYSFRDLAGVGVAFKLCQALRGDLCEDLIDLVAMGTVADVMPLINENRVIVKNGLLLRNKALCMLASRIGLDKVVTVKDIGFMLAPRVNAVGRMDDAFRMVEFFTTDDDLFIEKMIVEMCSLNDERKDIQKQHVDNSYTTISQMPYEESFVYVIQDDIEKGVAGLVSGKITETYNRPSLVITKHGSGSGRSIDTIDIKSLLDNFTKHFHKMGGHKKAVGFSLKSPVEDLRKDLNNYVRKYYKPIDLMPRIEYDMEIENFSGRFVESLEDLAPFGEGNRNPIFRINNVKVVKSFLVNKKHISMVVEKGEEFDAIMFNSADYKPMLHDTVDLIGEIEMSDYTKKYQFIITDFINHQFPDISDFGPVLKFIMSEEKTTLCKIADKFNNHKKIEFIVMVLEELGYVRRVSHVVKFNTNTKNKIEDSKIYNKFVASNK